MFYGAYFKHTALKNQNAHTVMLDIGVNEVARHGLFEHKSPPLLTMEYMSITRWS